MWHSYRHSRRRNGRTSRLFCGRLLQRTIRSLTRRFLIRWVCILHLAMGTSIRSGSFMLTFILRCCDRRVFGSLWWGMSCWALRSGTLRRSRRLRRFDRRVLGSLSSLRPALASLLRYRIMVEGGAFAKCALLFISEYLEPAHEQF